MAGMTAKSFATATDGVVITATVAPMVVVRKVVRYLFVIANVSRCCRNHLRRLKSSYAFRDMIIRPPSGQTRVVFIFIPKIIASQSREAIIAHSRTPPFTPESKHSFKSLIIVSRYD